MKLPFAALSLVAFFATWLLPSQEARACSCLPPPPPKTALERSSAVFIAEVASVAKKSDRDVAVTLDVTRAFKGGAKGRVTLLTPTSSAACGRDFAPGRSYLIYAEEVDGTLRDHLCTRTGLLEHAQHDVAALDAIARGAPVPEEPEPAVEGGEQTPPSGAAGEEPALAEDASAKEAQPPPASTRPPGPEPEGLKSGGNCAATGQPTSLVLAALALLSLLWRAAPRRG